MDFDSPAAAPRPSHRRAWLSALGGMVPAVLVAVTVGVGTFAYAGNAASTDSGAPVEFRPALTVPSQAPGENVAGTLFPRPDLGTPSVTRHVGQG
ncbi:hypothetical protein [Rhodococcus jostii]|uniref:Uncharacterized protein n=1 Tax=Rhodococcus jostii TaxID=132919 RepID=A0A1H5HQM3_RHOJO|nr:hypothetical protein [Rhodococcus jostii]SEE30223.1 hypothetical protein SAMN04490220_7305 [Rhodococcus jostii]